MDSRNRRVLNQSTQASMASIAPHCSGCFAHPDRPARPRRADHQLEGRELIVSHLVDRYGGTPYIIPCESSAPVHVLDRRRTRSSAERTRRAPRRGIVRKLPCAAGDPGVLGAERDHRESGPATCVTTPEGLNRQPGFRRLAMYGRSYQTARNPACLPHRRRDGSLAFPGFSGRSGAVDCGPFRTARGSGLRDGCDAAKARANTTRTGAPRREQGGRLTTSPGLIAARFIRR